MTDEQLHLDLPPIAWPYFWVVEVSRTSVNLCIQKRTLFWPWRIGHIENKAYIYVHHKDQITQALLNELSGRGYEMAKQVDPRKAVKAQFKGVKFTVPVRVKKN